MQSVLEAPTKAIFFDKWQPGTRNNDKAHLAKMRYLQASGKKRLPDTAQIHHANWDRGDGRLENLIIAKDQEQHENWHRQLIKFVVDSVNNGLLKFDLESLRYFSDHPLILELFKK